MTLEKEKDFFFLSGKFSQFRTEKLLKCLLTNPLQKLVLFLQHRGFLEFPWGGGLWVVRGGGTKREDLGP
jgi:hypothetical protein